MAPNKTDANHADGLAHLAEVGFYREVRSKGFASMLSRTLVAARDRLVRVTTGLSNQIRGLMKTSGIIVPAGKGGSFDAQVQELLRSDQTGVASIVWPLLRAGRSARLQAAELSRQLVADARKSQACRLSMSLPSSGAVTATAFATAIEDPANFKRSRSVGAWLGLTTRRYQSDQVDYDGHISRKRRPACAQPASIANNVGASFSKNATMPLRRSLRRSTGCSAAFTPWSWKMCFDVSILIR